MRMELVDPEGTLRAEIADTRLTRDDVAMTYAMALVSSQVDSINWPAVNRAIIDRWSLSALRYVKEKAWRTAQSPRKAASDG